MDDTIDKQDVLMAFNVMVRDVLTLCEVSNNDRLAGAVKAKLFVFADTIGLKKGGNDGNR